MLTFYPCLNRESGNHFIIKQITNLNHGAIRIVTKYLSLKHRPCGCCGSKSLSEDSSPFGCECYIAIIRKAVQIFLVCFRLAEYSGKVLVCFTLGRCQRRILSESLKMTAVIIGIIPKHYATISTVSGSSVKLDHIAKVIDSSW